MEPDGRIPYAVASMYPLSLIHIYPLPFRQNKTHPLSRQKDDSGHQPLRKTPDYVCRGEQHLLLGHNGAGKTTLMRLMHGLLWPAEGRIVWHTSEGEETSPIAGHAPSGMPVPALRAAGRIAAAHTLTAKYKYLFIGK